MTALAALALAACAIPPVDRELLRSERAPVRLEGARGPLSHGQSAAILEELRKRSPDTSIFDRHVAVEEALAGSPLSVGNQVTLLEDGPETFEAMLQAIRGARHHIHFEMYIFEADGVGRRFAEALKERRRAGVQVRLVFDGVGSLRTPKEFFRELADAGVEVVEYNPVDARAVLAKGLALNRRNHRKLTLIDGRVVFLGGINISGAYTPEGALARQKGGAAGSAGEGSGYGRSDDPPFDARPWRDTQVRIEGPVVAEFQRSFLALWGRMLKEKPPADPGFFPPLPPRGKQVVRMVEGQPDAGANALYVALISAIESAEQAVRITNAYFVPHEDLLQALQGAARRGVEVRLLLPSRTDNWVVLHAGRSYYDELLAAGVRIHERKERLLHAKSASVDGVWSTVGSTNLDWRSLVHNEEINAVVLGPEFAAQLDELFARDLGKSEEITLGKWRRRPVADRMKELAARAWAYLL